MNMKYKLMMVGFLLIAFIGISIGINGFELIPETQISADMIYLNQTHDFNGVTYNLVSVDEFENLICINISEFQGIERCINGNINNLSSKTVSFEKEIDTTEYNKGKIVLQDIPVYNDKGMLVRTYAIITVYKKISTGTVDYNSLELDEKITEILFAECINLGECESLPEVYQPTVFDMIDDLTTQIEILEAENTLIKNELCRISKDAYNWCLIGVGN